MRLFRISTDAPDAMDDDDIADRIRDLIESDTAWIDENRKAALTWLRQVSISHQAAVHIIAQSEATMRSAGIKPPGRPWMRRTPGRSPMMSGGAA
jgi:hypothetical protein